MASNKELVLITGGSGFQGGHCILSALQHGYRVRTTVRSLSKADDVRKALKSGGATEEQIRGVEFAAADLLKDDGWQEACQGATYVLHVASPFPSTVPKDENELINPAREGTLRALRAAKAAGTVKRVVVTSSYAAVGYGHPYPEKSSFTEEDWTQLDNPAIPVPAYPKSKTLAEQAAWQYAEKEGIELATVNPVGIYGPVLAENYSTSVELIVRCMNGQMPALPDMAFGVVDARDVADLHIRAMVNENAAGQRFLAVADGGFPTIKQIALTLKNRLGDKAKRVPTMVAPNFVLKLVSFVDPTVAMIVPDLSKRTSCSNEKAKNMLGWQPRSAEDALVATAESLENLGLLKK